MSDHRYSTLRVSFEVFHVHIVEKISKWIWRSLDPEPLKRKITILKMVPTRSPNFPLQQNILLRGFLKKLTTVYIHVFLHKLCECGPHATFASYGLADVLYLSSLQSASKCWCQLYSEQYAGSPFGPNGLPLVG